MAEIEKAIIDSVDKPKRLGGIEEILAVVCRSYRRVGISKLIDYAMRMKTQSFCQGLGFMLGFLASKGLVDHLARNLRVKLLGGASMTPIYIGPRGRGGDCSRDWRVVKAVSDRQLVSEIPFT
jgi:predicted transcriptional regulator of viral defense system